MSKMRTTKPQHSRCTASRKGLLRLFLWSSLVWLGVVFTTVTHYHTNYDFALIFPRVMPLSSLHFAPSPPESPCDQVQSLTRRAFCQQDLAATNDQKVAAKFAKLILEAEKQSLTPSSNYRSKHSHSSFHDAAIACALAVELPTCVHDVLAYNNVTVAAAFETKPLPFRNQLGTVIMDEVLHEFTEVDAEQACKGVPQNSDRIFCEKHFIQLDDEAVAQHYIHLYLDLYDTRYKKPSPSSTSNSKEEAQILCASVANFQYYEQCMSDVPVLPNDYHLGVHFVQLYKTHADGTVSQIQAEKLCNHLPRRRRHVHACINQLVTMKGQDAATHFLQYFRNDQLLLLEQQVQQQKRNATTSSATTTRLLDLKQAQTICASEQWDECIHDVQTMNSVAAAQIYAELLLWKQKETSELGTNRTGPL